MTMRANVPGLALAVALGLAGAAVHHVFPVVSTVLATLVLGLAIGLFMRRDPFRAGASFATKKGLDAAVVLLGFSITVATAREVGAPGLILAVGAVTGALVLFIGLARLTRLPTDTALLLGVGTGVCGISAVAAASRALDTREEDAVVAMGAVGVLSTIALLVYPLAGALLAISPVVYGAWAGASIHAVANAVAAGFALGDDAGRAATLVKLARVAMLPLVILALASARGMRGAKLRVPWMIWGFLAAVIATNTVPLPVAAREWIGVAAHALLVVAMGALGFSTDLRALRGAAGRSVALALAGWLILAGAALAAAEWLLA